MALENSLSIQVIINSHSRNEPNEMRDPETGTPLTTISSRIPHFLHANQDSLNLRATLGLQSLINRTYMGQQVFSDLFVQPLLQSAVDTLFTYNNLTGPQYVPYPVLTVIPPKLKGGKLFIRVDLYLYPLKKYH